MKTNHNSINAFNEIIFENRNKSYGAYVHRREHNDNILKGLLVTAAIAISIAFYAGRNKENKLITPIIEINDTLVSIEIDVTPEQPEEIAKKEPIKEPETPKSISGQFEVSNNAKDSVSETNEKMKISSNPNPNGIDTTGVKDKVGTIIIKKDDDDEKKPVQFPDSLPEFKNLQNFILAKLRYPEGAKYNGTQGKVFISFMVETDGSVSEVKALNKIGDGCEEEAVRVVNTMKGWKPGIFKGKKRRVPVTLPIHFKLK